MDGCDSVVTLDLTIKGYSTTGTDVITACDSYTWIDGISYNYNNNTATHTLTNSVGCDSIVTLSLTINGHSTTGTDVQTACDSYTWIDGITYNSSNNSATHTLINATGCDSIVTLDLTINYTDTIYTTILACDSFVWNGLNYTTSGNYTNYSIINGCFSIDILDLTIINSYNVSATASICTGDTYIFGSQTLTSSGTYTETFSSIIGGCDSTVILTLKVFPVYFDSISATICYGETYIYGNDTLSVNGTYIDTFTSLSGCDSVKILDLTVMPPPPNVSIYGNDSVFISDTSTYFVNDGDSMVWSISGGQIINGNNSNTITVVWDTAGTAYIYLEVYDSNACFWDSLTKAVHVSDIVTSINEFDHDYLIVYPNPFDNTATLEFNNNGAPHTMVMYNLLGETTRVVNNIRGNKYVINKGNLNPGIYYIEVTYGLKKLQTRIIIE
jgi:hypothetical protein